jgi:hypothetical protein
MANEEKFAPVEGKYLNFLEQPLVREGHTICYGDKSEKCFLILEIMSYKKERGYDLPEKILIQVVDSKDPGKIIKQGEKEGLHNALSIGMVWLERANRA